MGALKRIFLLAFFHAAACLFCCQDSHAQTPLRKDSSNVVVRGFQSQKLNGYRESREFRYDNQSMRGLTVWDRFWVWFWNEVSKLMARDNIRIGFKILLWALALGITSYAVIRVLGMEKIMVWMRGEKAGLPGTITEEDNIYGIDFEKEISEAVSAAMYREAVRLLYLKSLRLLSDSSLIEWAPSKTNIDYAAELASSGLDPEFQQITRYYEYAWYGEFNLNSEDYNKVSQSFTHFNNRVKG